MPIPFMSVNYDGFNERASFKYRYCVWPRRCYNTKQWIWLETAMRGRAVWTGPGDHLIEDRWYHRHEALVMMIKGVADGNI
jgi:hypothetical protein